MFNNEQDRPVGDTPEAQEAAPIGETRKLAGKYESVEALEAGYKELESKLGQQADMIKRLESLIVSTPNFGYEQSTPAAYQPQATPEPSAEPTDYITRAEAERIAEARLESRLREYALRARAEQQLTAEQQYWRAEFFRKNPDLQDDETLVWGVTREVGERYAHYPPQVFRAMMPNILDEIATKTREKLARIRAAGKADAEQKAAMRAEGQVPGTVGPAGPPPAQKPKTLDELRQQEILEEILQARQMRNPLMR